MHPELKKITTSQLTSALETDGFVWVRSKGSHRVYRHGDGRRVIISFHRPGATFPPKTLMLIIRTARWNEDDLRRLHLIS